MRTCEIFDWGTAFTLTNLNLFADFGGTWSVQGLRSLEASQRAAMRAQMSFACLTSELPP